jgi:uncharacterized short protein YbdD (DUF466 family)
MSLGTAVHRGVRSVRWFMRGVMGADAYERYLDHHAAHHGAAQHPPMTEREFWRDRDDRRDHEAQGRCC